MTPERLTVAAILLFGLLVGFRPVAGMDYHFHLAMGRAHLAQGPRLKTDPLSVLPAIRPPDMGAWGAATLMAWLEGWGGTVAVQALFASLTALYFLLAYRLGRRHLDRRELAFLLFAVAAAAATHRIRLRPDLFSLVGVLLMLSVILDEPTPRRAVSLFFLVLVWAQLHPGVLIAPVLAGIVAVGPEFRRRWHQPVLAAAALCLTPRGPLDSLDLLFETLKARSLVSEWNPLWALPFKDYVYAWGLVALCGLAVLWASCSLWRRSPGLWGLAGFGLLGPFRGYRLMHLLVPSLLVSLSSLTSKIPRGPWARRFLWSAAVILLVAVPFKDRIERALACRRFGLSPFAALYEPNYPVQATRFLEETGLQGNVFTPVRWGGYVGLHLSPPPRMAHDGRVSLFGVDLARELLGWRRPGALGRLADDFGIEILVLPVEDANVPRGRWVPVHSDPAGVVFVDRRGRHGPANLERLR